LEGRGARGAARRQAAAHRERRVLSDDGTCNLGMAAGQPAASEAAAPATLRSLLPAPAPAPETALAPPATPATAIPAASARAAAPLVAGATPAAAIAAAFAQAAAPSSVAPTLAAAGAASGGGDGSSGMAAAFSAERDTPNVKTVMQVCAAPRFRGRTCLPIAGSVRWLAAPPQTGTCVTSDSASQIVWVRDPPSTSGSHWACALINPPSRFAPPRPCTHCQTSTHTETVTDGQGSAGAG
jgi:hypothetical protein